MASNEKYCLRWNDFETNISTAFRELREQKDFFDVTLACDDKQVQAHKVILSACSPFFRTILRGNPHQHPLLYLRGVKYSELVNVLNFMYQGEVNIAQEELTEFLSVADDLRVKGLAQGGTTQGKAKSNIEKDTPLVNNGPPSKRKRRSPSPVLAQCSTAPLIEFPEEDDIEEVIPQVKQEPILVTPSVMVDQDPIETSHDMVLEGNPQYEESYDGFQYDGDQAYDETSMMDSSMGDGNKEVLHLVQSMIETYYDAGRRVNRCKVCHKTYIPKHLVNLRCHIEARHLDGRCFTCQQCEKTFNTSRTLKGHIQKAHSSVLSNCHY